MKVLLKLFLFLSVFFIALLYFLPKIAIYNLAEKELSNYNIIISDEIRKENAFSLNLKNMSIYYDGINSFTINNAKLDTYIFFTDLQFNNIIVSNTFKNMFPSKIKNININHSILDLNNVNINAIGDFGEIIARYIILENKIILELKPSRILKTKYRNILKQFKLKEGRYYYEYKF